MAKGNALLGTLRGSTGDVTFRVSNGRQVMSKRARVVRNPKTSKQTYQRMFFATIAKAQSAMKKIVDHSFENVEHGAKSLRYFSSKNIALMRQNAKFDYNLQAWVSPGMSFVPPRTVGATFNKYRVSEGSLSPNNVMPFVKEAPDSPDTFIPAVFMPPFTDNKDNISKGSDLNKFSVQVSVVDEMLRNEGCVPGDFMTAVFMSAKKNDINEAGAGVFYPCQFHYVRFKVVAIGAAGSEDPGTGLLEGSRYLIPSNVDGKIFDFPNVIPNVPTLELPVIYNFWRGEGNNYIMPNAVSMAEIHDFTIPINGADVAEYHVELPLSSVDDQILCATWIHSRPDGDKILCSTQDMLLFDPTGDVFDFNLGLMDAFDLWNQGVVAVGNSEYILEGGNK